MSSYSKTSFPNATSEHSVATGCRHSKIATASGNISVEQYAIIQFLQAAAIPPASNTINHLSTWFVNAPARCCGVHTIMTVKSVKMEYRTPLFMYVRGFLDGIIVNHFDSVKTCTAEQQMAVQIFHNSVSLWYQGAQIHTESVPSIAKLSANKRRPSRGAPVRRATISGING